MTMRVTHAGHGEVEEEEGPGVVEDGLTRAIIDSENTNAWTLMHRFNRSADLLQQTLNGGFDDPAHATAALCAPFFLHAHACRYVRWLRRARLCLAHTADLL